MPNQGDPVNDEEFLYRRAYSSPPIRYLYEDGSATSRVFKPREKDEGKLSVDVKSLTTFETSIVDKTKFMLFEIANMEVLSLNLNTIHDPTPNEASPIENPAHALIIGMDADDDITPSLLAKKAKNVKG
jgi:hypothetical protein